jgi:hypothetical protein
VLPSTRACDVHCGTLSGTACGDGDAAASVATDVTATAVTPRARQAAARLLRDGGMHVPLDR